MPARSVGVTRHIETLAAIANPRAVSTTGLNQIHGNFVE